MCKHTFSSFSPRPTTIDVNLEQLSKIFKTCRDNDIVRITKVEEETTIDISFESREQERYSNYRLKLIDTDMERLDVPDEEYSCVIKIPTQEYGRIVRDFANFGDSLQVRSF